ncbi:MAG TPA: ABC transporter permease, partial [Candidatus Limnocylindria bacterium]|nr:ABC transporter permease [Candidatus Limnocylindria bacterium]
MRPTDLQHVDLELAGIDNLELPITSHQSLPWRVWRSAWPLLAAIGVVIAIWQIVVLAGWRPPHVLPPPIEVGQRLVENLTDSSLLSAIGTTMRRIGMGFGLALVIGSLLGIAIVRWSTLRTAIASL